VILVFVAAALWLVSRILASPLGAVMEAIRENDKRAAACGYDVRAPSCWCSCCRPALCGLAGALRALHLSVVPIDSLHYLTSGHAVMMCLLGGMGTFFGPFVGRRGVPVPGGRGHQPHQALDGGGRRHLHAVRAVLPARHLGHAAARMRRRLHQPEPPAARDVGEPWMRRRRRRVRP
jgi:hypothetical protein